jgi:Capsule polysaccharide biosynthesis protein
MINVLFLDRSNPDFLNWIHEFSRVIGDSGVRLLFLTDKEASIIHGNLEIINVNDVPQRLNLTDLQEKYSFSIYRTIVPERAFVDYSSFRRSQCYSRLTMEEIELKVRPYYNALDYVIRERADLVLDGLADNFMTAAAGSISQYYCKPFRMIFVYYWWNDGVLMVDRNDQTSSSVDQDYEKFYANPKLVDRAKIDKLFSKKKLTLAYSGLAGNYPLKKRLAQIANRFKSYEPPSFMNWMIRRFGRLSSRMLISSFIKRHKVRPDTGKFLLFPLHVSPEASLLGSCPELADQFSLIKNISINLPFGVSLYVKEHPHQMVGDSLDFEFYRRLNSLPNVKYFTDDACLDSLLKDTDCIAVATINGTVGIEAALIKKPVFVFGQAIYGAADCFLKPRDFSEFRIAVMEILKGRYTFDDDALYAILMALDNSVIRADINLNDQHSWEAVSLATIPIYQNFIHSQSWRGNLK